MRLAGDPGLVVGVDTHLDTHAAALCDGRGRLVAQRQVPATAAGYARLLAWARAAAGDAPVVWAVEGTRHYGLGLARCLASAGQHVAEIDASRHVGKRRAGKSDAIDAVRAARELLARPRPGQMRADGDREALRLLMIDRDNAVASAKTARTLLASVLVTAPAPLRERLGRIPRDRRARECATLICPRRADRQTRVLHQTLPSPQSSPAVTHAERLALAGFLTGYRGLTREACTLDLGQSTCRDQSQPRPTRDFRLL